MITNENESGNISANQFLGIIERISEDRSSRSVIKPNGSAEAMRMENTNLKQELVEIREFLEGLV